MGPENVQVPDERSKTLTVVIPTLNEAQTIGEIIEKVRALHGSDILVVDGHSPDGTAEIARAWAPASSSTTGRARARRSAPSSPTSTGRSRSSSTPTAPTTPTTSPPSSGPSSQGRPTTSPDRV